MSKYTTEVRFICESLAELKESAGFDSIDEILRKSAPLVFNFAFPLYDESYRQILEYKILLHYYTQEIGFETVGLWKLNLRRKLNEIMPYYNELYKSALLEFNPLYNVDLTRQYSKTGEGTQDTTGETTGTGETEGTDTNVIDQTGTTKGTNNRTGNNTVSGTKNQTNKHSDTPQGALTGLSSDKYMSAADINTDVTSQETETTDTETNESTSTGKQTADRTTTANSTTKSTEKKNAVSNSIESYIETVRGKDGGESMSSLIKQFRETLLNIDMLIIDDIAELFMNIW